MVEEILSVLLRRSGQYRYVFGQGVYLYYRHPRGIQRVLDRYVWDHRAVREDLRRYVVTELGDPERVLLDETGFVKQGKHSVGVARQYCGTVGKIANCQIRVFLGYASPQGYAGIDGSLFIPQGWSRTRSAVRRWGYRPGQSIAPSPS